MTTMKNISLLSTGLFAIALASCSPSTTNEPMYMNPDLAVEKRVDDLLDRMTLEEKIGQMNQFVGIEHMKEAEENVSEEDLATNTASAFYPGITSKDVHGWLEQGLIGSFLHVVTPEEANELQRVAMNSRLHIPILFGIDAIHGNANCPGNTVYPTNIGLASSFDTEMAYKIARQTAKEMRAMNMHWTFNPNVEVARDGRWGRVGETFGESPYLVARLGEQTVKGYQGNLDSENDVLACIKHFVAGSQSLNGTNGAAVDISERTIRELFFPPFQAGVEAGAMSLMMSHNELNGVPCHANKWLMTDVLRKEWNFPGFIVSDWMDIEYMHTLHYTAESYKEAFYQSIMAGMDMHMHGIRWNEMVKELVEEGRIPESRIDESVRRILTIKFRLGLFENPYADIKRGKQIRLCDEHKATALEASRNSIVLLKNTGILPLDNKKLKRIMVTGINADDQNIMGDWSSQQAPEDVTTILEGLKIIAPDINFDFVDQGWDPRNMNPKQVDKAVQQAKKADLNIVVAGEYMMRFRWNDRTCGEDTDRDNLQLVGLQNELIERIYNTGIPTILVLVNGRPLATEWADQHLPAIIEAWEPGMLGGQAVAEVIFGKINPSAKLAVTIPRSVGQIQTVFNHKPSMYFHPVVCGTSEPLYRFGHGLSYSTFTYKNLQLDKKTVTQDGSVKVSVELENTSDIAGTEIVQLYIRDEYSSVTRPVKELRDFKRVYLEGKTKTIVNFELPTSKLAFYDIDMNWTVEPGTFIVMIGGSTYDNQLLKAKFTVN